MIKVETKVHDKFSVEFKVGFIPQNKGCNNDFKINTWIFVPNSLDINPSNYGKDQFYRDVKSNIRLITPHVELKDIVANNVSPFLKLKKNVLAYKNNNSDINYTKYEYHVKMFAAICKSSIRNKTHEITSSTDIKSTMSFTRNYITNIINITTTYRDFIHSLKFKRSNDKSPLIFADEFLSQIIDSYILRVLSKISILIKKTKNKTLFSNETNSELLLINKELLDFLVKEKIYKKEHHYFYIRDDDEKNNRYVIFRHGLLKKFIESDMYIKLNKKEDGFALKQVLYGTAAGLAMIFATIIAFSFKWKYGSVSLQLFIALVVSYIFKDRMKELMRYYLSDKLRSQYFDDKADIKISSTKVGWIKEAVNFIKEKNMPEEIINIRNRSSLLQYENEIFDEKIIFYRKQVFLDGKKLAKHDAYKTNGLNDILRLHMNRFVQKTDNPIINLKFINKENKVGSTKAQKIYYINIIMQFVYNKQLEYKRFRIVLLRTGILEIQTEEEINSCKI